MSGSEHKRRGRIVLKSSRRNSQQSNISDTSTIVSTDHSQSTPHTHNDQHTWASPVVNTTNGEMDKLISTRNQLKKEIFGQTPEREQSQPYPVHSTPVRSGLSHPDHHTLNTLPPPHGSQVAVYYISSSSEGDGPDFCTDGRDAFKSSTAPLLDQYGLTTNHDRARARSPRYTGKQVHHHNVVTATRQRTHSPVHTSSTDSSPLHRPLRTHSTETFSKKKAKSRQRRNQVGPSVHYDLPSHNGVISPPHNHSTHFNVPDLGRTFRNLNNTTIHDYKRTSDNVPDSELNTSLGRGTPNFESTRQRLFSTADSLSSSLSTTLTPLLTSNLRKGGRKPSEKSCFDFDAEGQLHGCFPNRQMRVFIVTWNMQEQKVRVEMMQVLEPHLESVFGTKKNLQAGQLHVAVMYGNSFISNIDDLYQTQLLPDSLDDLLLPLSQETAADLFVIGTQESTPSRGEWEILLQQTLGPSYVLVQSASLGVIYLTLYLRRDLIWFCSAVQCSTFATRLGSLIKTKGGVGVSFTLFGTSFLFITSHLTAHEHKVQERNTDMLKIAANLTLGPDSSDKGSVLSGYDHVFWFGDLNYRVDTTREQADQCVASADWRVLLLKDQLTREILQGNAFQGFSEQPISFPPSYKFDTNTDTYDSSEKKRIPSWTDRILFKSLKGNGITGCGYNSCTSLRISDHRPVYAICSVALEPSKHLEGVPVTLVSFDRNTYTQAQQRRRQLAEELAIPQTSAEEPDGPGRPSSKRVTSSMCVVL